MAASQTLQKDGQTLDVLESSACRIMVNRTGAELISLARREFRRLAGLSLSGRRDGRAGFRLGKPCHCDGLLSASPLEGTVSLSWCADSRWQSWIPLRHFVFDPPEVTERALLYRVPVSRVPPRRLSAQGFSGVELSIVGGWPTRGIFFTNEEPELDAHVSFGLHPGFAVSSVKTCRCSFPRALMCGIMHRGIFSTGARRQSLSAAARCPLIRRSCRIPTCLVWSGSERVFVLEDAASRPSHRLRLFRGPVSYALGRQGDLHLC